MNYGYAESEIVNRLNTYFNANGVANFYEASLLPDTEDGFRTFYNNFTKARVAVEFIESLPQPSQALSFVSQDETVRFRLTFEARKLRGEGGFYNMVELCKLALIGFKLTNARNRLTMVKYGLLEFEQGKWQPYFEFESTFVNVQSFNDDPDAIPFGDAPVTIMQPPEIFGQEFTNEYQ